MMRTEAGSIDGGVGVRVPKCKGWGWEGAGDQQNADTLPDA